MMGIIGGLGVPVLNAVGICVIIFLAAMGQSAVGFGASLFATPLLIFLGLPLPNAIALVTTCALLQATMGARRLRAEVPWRLALTSTGVRLLSLFAGILVLRELVQFDADDIRMVIGFLLCLLVLVQLVWKPHPVPSLHWGWAGLAFLSSGFIAGICGMGGPPLVLWLMAHDWSPRKTRGFLFAVFATTIPIQIALLWWTFGASIPWMVAFGFALFPAVYLGTAIGLPIGNRMQKSRLRAIAYGILLLIGISSMASSWR
jgi:uncharacterized membrane protein YfcA